MLCNVKMYGYAGTVQDLGENKFLVTINEQEVSVQLRDEEWNEGCEYTPQEVAFTEALDEIKE